MSSRLTGSRYYRDRRNHYTVNRDPGAICRQLAYLPPQQTQLGRPRHSCNHRYHTDPSDTSFGSAICLVDLLPGPSILQGRACCFHYARSHCKYLCDFLDDSHLTMKTANRSRQRVRSVKSDRICVPDNIPHGDIRRPNLSRRDTKGISQR